MKDVQKSIGNTIVPEKIGPTVWRRYFFAPFGWLRRTITRHQRIGAEILKGDRDSYRRLTATPCGIMLGGRCSDFTDATGQTCKICQKLERWAAPCAELDQAWREGYARYRLPKVVFQAGVHLCHVDCRLSISTCAKMRLLLRWATRCAAVLRGRCLDICFHRLTTWLGTLCW